MENPDLVLQETVSRPTYSRLNYVPSGDTLCQDAISSLISDPQRFFFEGLDLTFINWFSVKRAIHIKKCDSVLITNFSAVLIRSISHFDSCLGMHCAIISSLVLLIGHKCNFH